MKEVKRNLFITIGTLFVVLAVIGIILPILPTTPFLLLAAYFYARSSRRFYTWLMTNRIFGDYIRNYRDGLGIPLKQKVWTILLLWLTMAYSVWFVVSLWWVQLLLIVIAAGVTTHLVRVRTYRPQESNPPQPVKGRSLSEETD